VVPASAIVRAVVVVRGTVAAGHRRVTTHAPSHALRQDPRCVAVRSSPDGADPPVQADVDPGAADDAVRPPVVDVRENEVIPEVVAAVQARERSEAADHRSIDDPPMMAMITDHAVHSRATMVEVRGQPARAMAALVTTVVDHEATVHHVTPRDTRLPALVLQWGSAARHHISAVPHQLLTTTGSSILTPA